MPTKDPAEPMWITILQHFDIGFYQFSENQSLSRNQIQTLESHG